MKKIIGLIFGLIFIVGAYAAWSMLHFMFSPMDANSNKEILFDVSPGRAFAPLANQLESEGLISNAKAFIVYARVKGVAGKVHVGEYALSPKMTPPEILSVLVAGQSVRHLISIPEGHNIFDIRDILNNKWPGRGDEFFELVTNKNYVKNTTGMDLPSMEGFLFPETYSVTKYTEAKELVKNMHGQFKRVYEEVIKDGQLKMPIKDHVALASVIEKETGAPWERPMISSVFHNRLKKGMRLQSDPTILYGILVETKEPKKNITRADIHRHTDYNTYTVRALPKGPIANPGREALHATLNPAESGYYYFVSKNDGTHVFTETYEKHKKAVAEYQLNPKAREGRSWRDLNRNQNRSRSK